MENNLIKTLKELKDIKPDADYSKRSRAVILSHEPIKPIGVFGVIKNFQSTGIMIAEISSVLVVVLLLGGLWFYNVNENKAAMVVKADELNASINVKLNEIRYLLLLTRTPLQKDQTNGFIDSLKKAEDELNTANAGLTDNKVDQSIEKIKSVEKSLLDIENQLKQLPKRTP